MRLRWPFTRTPKAEAARQEPRPPAVAHLGTMREITTAEELEAAIRGGTTTTSGQSVTRQSALQQAAVHRCVSILSGVVANLPLRPLRRVGEDTREPARDHWSWRLMARRPNVWQTPEGFRRMLQLHVLFKGNGYAYKVPAVGGRVQALWPLDADRMGAPVQSDEDMQLNYPYRRKDGTLEVFRQSEILHLRGLSWDGIVGLSVLQFAREQIGLAQAEQRHGGKHFASGISASTLETDKPLSDPARHNLKASLDEFRGEEGVAKTMILEEGLKYNAVGMSHADAQWLEARAFDRREIAMFYGVPPVLLGDTEKVTSFGSGVEHMQIGFRVYGLEDWLTMWEQSWERDLYGAPADEDLTARFRRQALERGDMKTRGQFYKDMLQTTVMVPDEVRAREDMNPRQDGGGGEPLPLPNESPDSPAADSPISNPDEV